MTVTALIVAAGSSSRMGGELPKQFRDIAGKAVLAHAIDALASHPAIEAVRVVIGEGQMGLAREALGNREVGDLIIGGAERADSVQSGLAAVVTDVILVHDAARPFCPHGVIDRLIEALQSADGAVPVLPITDTLARADHLLGDPIDRDGAVRVQTPQAFRLAELRDAYAGWLGKAPTDEASVARAAGLTVAAVEGDAALDKLTNASDWARAETAHAERLISRTAMGFDVHAFAGEGPIKIGGIEVPHERGLAGHSDADVVLHAITDALLGAAGLGDIGQHFPPSDPQWKGADSAIFLAHTAALVRQAGGLIDFIDCTIIAEAPRVGPYRDAMQSRIADVIGLPPSHVSIKATTTERLGFTGRREGIAAQGRRDNQDEFGTMSDYLLPDELVAKARQVIDANRAAGRRVAVAKSCTGGLVSAALTEIPGSSEVFEAGYVTYSNHAKMSELNVCLDVVETFGSVSVATAWAMAQGALEASGADIAVAITGIAGPDGGTAQKPVGTVVFARAERASGSDEIVADQKLFDASEGRSGIRRQAALCALDLLMP